MLNGLRFGLVRPVSITVLAVAALVGATLAGAANAAVPPPSSIANATAGDGSLDELRTRADSGDKAAAAKVCDLLFNTDKVHFDGSASFAACKRAAELGDATAIDRVGMMTLAGVGTAQSLGAAAELCRRAGAIDAAAPGGFCVAAIRAETRRSAGAIRDVDAPQPPPASLDAAKIARLQSAAERGDHVALGGLCTEFFDAPLGAFDPSRTADWCRRAAGFGDSDAMRRLGLMRFWGVGMEKSSAGATALCTEAQARDPAVSAGFCLAAIDAERLRTAEAAAPARYTYPQPWSVAQERGLLPNPLSPDRVLETVRETPTGLHYSCHDMIRWARYGLALYPNTFGRPLTEYRPADYTALDLGASECERDIAPYDLDGSQRRLLQTFRGLLPSLEQQQKVLLAAASQQQAEKQQAATQYASQRRDLALLVASLTPEQSRCVEAIRRDWLAGRISPGAQSMEIRSIGSDSTGGNVVVAGVARVIPSIYQDRYTPMTYTCTVDAQSQKILGASVRPSGPSVSPQFASP